jgi:hypothetical protein
MPGKNPPLNALKPAAAGVRFWGIRFLIAVLVLSWDGCNSPPHDRVTDQIDEDFSDISGAPVVGALYHSQIPGLDFPDLDLRDAGDGGDNGTHHVLDSQTVKIAGDVKVGRDGQLSIAVSNFVYQLSSAENAPLPHAFEVQIRKVDFDSKARESAETPVGSPSASSRLKSQTVLMSRVVVFRQWHQKAEGHGMTFDYSADFPEYVDGSRFHRQVSEILAENARRYVTGNIADVSGFTPGTPNNHWGDQTAFIVTCTENILSVGFDCGDSGGAHVNHWRSAYNFANDGEHARQFSMADLFIPTSGWEKKLSDLCIADLFRQYGPPNSDERVPTDVLDGSMKILPPELFSEFFVKPSGLEINFGPYALGGGRSGDFTVTTPWPALRGYLRPNGPARFLTNFPIATDAELTPSL